MRYLKDVGTLNFTNTGYDTIKIPRHDPIRNVYIDFYTEITTVGTATAFADGQPYTLIKKARLFANGSRDLVNARGKYLRLINKRLNGAEYQAQKPTVLTAQSSTVTRFLVQLPCADPKLGRPVETMLEPRGLGSLDLEVNFGNATSVVLGTADIMSGGTSVTLANTSIRVFVEYEINVPLQSSPDGKVVGSDSLILANRSIYEQEMTIAATSTAMKFDLPARNNFGRFFLFTEKDGVLDSTILNRVTLKSGQKVHFSLYDENIHDLNVGEFALGAQDAGCYVIDFLADGRISQALPAGKEVSLELELDVTKQGTTSIIRVLPDEFILPPLR